MFHRAIHQNEGHYNDYSQRFLSVSGQEIEILAPSLYMQPTLQPSLQFPFAVIVFPYAPQQATLLEMLVTRAERRQILLKFNNEAFCCFEKLFLVF
jgi:hypothetical protein